jgi:hypothetical protein
MERGHGADVRSGREADIAGTAEGERTLSL